MRLNVLYFGVLKELFAVDRETIEVPAGTTVEDVLSLSRLRASNLRPSRESEVWKVLAVAVNREYAERTTVLQDGDEVALLPPVSGGAGEESWAK
jgi:molybdopterin converting factor subunit 1